MNLWLIPLRTLCEGFTLGFMNRRTPSPEEMIASLAMASLSRTEENRFSSEVESLIRHAESNRLQFMEAFQKRENLSNLLGLLAVLLGGAGFGWFFLMQGSLFRGLLVMLVFCIVPFALYFWSRFPLKAYQSNYKSDFMPQMAKALGGLKFFPSRGISNKILPATGIVPMHDRYTAEDCFMGMYKGVKVILSEARLFHKKNKAAVFDGIFVLLEIPAQILEGHTVISADKDMVHRYEKTRWKNFRSVDIQTSHPSWDRFDVFSDRPESASLLIGEKLLKELAEAADVFDQAPLSAAFFRGKYIFLSIPYTADMFEASNIFVPVATKRQALTCRREIEQILEIIDVFDIYENKIG